MTFIANENVEFKTKIRNLYDFYSDAENKGVSLTPFDIYKYVDTFENIKVINAELETTHIGVIQKRNVKGND